MVNPYKSKVLAYIEGKTPAINHAAQSALQRVDNIQEQFMRSAGLTDIEAICGFRLAPLCSRRDMALLGVIHRTVLGLGPEQFSEYFTLDVESRHLDGKECYRRHNRPNKHQPKGETPRYPFPIQYWASWMDIIY